MRKLKVLELFAGTRSIGKAFEKNGHEVYSVEWDEQHKDIDCSINFFIEKALILGKTDLVNEYTNLRKKEMPECIY